MLFRQHQREAQSKTWRLLAWFALLLAGLTLSINVLLALVYKLFMPFGSGFPALFFETNTGVILLFVLGGCIVETQRLHDGGGPRVARWMGGREVIDPDDATERRLLNVVDEMALASGQPLPRVFVMPREDAINAFVAGWSAQDMVMCVTRGALDRLTRAELQGLVAHEFGHIKENDLHLCMRMLALVWGLSLVYGYGQTLMATDDEGRVSPAPWAIGVVLLAVGWLGWMAGRLLQAAVSRQREFLADASAIQFTRSRDGLGNVLRKLWHDQQMLAGRMRHPSADMVASLLVHDPGIGVMSRLLATHPKLPARIERIHGAVLPPLPAPLLRLDAVEPRRPRPAPAVADLAVATSSFAAPVDPIKQAEQQRVQRRFDDKQALSYLQTLVGPTERRLIVVALMTGIGNDAERTLWHKIADGLPQGPRILEEVTKLLPSRRLPEFERLCLAMKTEPIEQRRTLVENARDMLRADGRVSPLERLWWLALRHRVGVQPTRQVFMRPMTGQGQDLLQLGDDERAHVASLTTYLARIIPMADTPDSSTAAGRAWFKSVMIRCGVVSPPDPGSPPDADALMHALTGVQELSWMIRPVLLKAWVEEALNHSPQGVVSDTTADALRLMAGLMDAPLPPILEAHYGRV